MIPFPAKCVPPGQGSTFTVLGGDQVTIKATRHDTGGAFTLLETIAPPYGGPPPHMHTRESETFYVLEGEFDFYIGDETMRAGVGTVILAPPGVPHRFCNALGSPGKLWILCQPAGFEDFMAEISELPQDPPPDPQRMAEIGAKYGITFLESVAHHVASHSV